jgi:hypothetical protein
MTVIAKDITVFIQDIEQRSTQKGKAYWLIKDGSRTFKTWSQKVAAAADALKDAEKPAFIIYHEDSWTGNTGREFTDLMVDELKPAPKDAQVDGPAPDDKMSKDEWNEKEDREHIRRLYVSHLIQMTNWWAPVPVDERQYSYADLIVEARKAAVHDLDWLRNYGTKDAPFS